MPLTAEQRAIKKKNYIDFSTRQSNVTNLLPDADYKIDFVKRPGDKQVFDWESKDKDLDVFNELWIICEQTAYMSDEQFRSLIPAIKKIASTSPLFRKLESVPPEKRSPAHQDTDPFTHTFNVLALLNTDGLTEVQRGKSRFYAIMHDPGKTVIAIDDIADNHAAISSLIYQDFLITKRGMDPESAKLDAQTILYHHIFQAIDDETLSIEEVQGLIDPEQMMYAGVLALADGRSIKKYQGLAAINAMKAIELMMQSIEQLADPDFIKKYANSLLLFVSEKFKEMGDFITTVMTWFDEKMKDARLGLNEKLYTEILRNRIAV